MEELLAKKPRLRWPLDLQPVEVKGQRYILIVDNQGLAPGPLLLPEPFLPIIARFDGQNSVGEIVAEGAHVGLNSEIVAQLISDLSQALLLDTPESHARWEEMKSAFAAASIRESSHAGLGYPQDSKELCATIEKYLSLAGPVSFESSAAENAVAFMSPHIDYQRGWRTYARGYSALQALNPPDAIVLLGTAHQASTGLYHLSKKTFRTPLGEFPAATSFIDTLSTAYAAKDLFSEEIIHKTEHSLDLQLPFLAYLFRNSTLPPIVPILVGSFHEYLLRAEEPINSGEAADFVAALSESSKNFLQSGKRILFVAGVDLAHMGRRFGDPEQLSPHALSAIQEKDEALLHCLLHNDTSALFQHIANDNDARRICGFPALYTMLATLKLAGIQTQGQLIDYQQSSEPTSDTIVTYASALWLPAGPAGPAA